jgi:outer membrane biosynthesis protein TonB
MTERSLALLLIVLAGPVPAAEPAMPRLAHEAIAKTVNARFGEIRACAEPAMAENARGVGKIVIEWSIELDGSVKKLRVKSAATKDQAVASCYSKAIRSWRFPKPTGGPVTVTYPFIICGAGY